MKLLILGRTASGKDTVAKNLEKYGLKRVVSYTDRPQRVGEPDDSHKFVSTDEIKELLPKMVATTEINGYTYGSTRKQVESSDIYVIDPNGVEEVVTNMPNTAFHILYVQTDDDARKKHYMNREGNKDGLEEIWQARNASEDMQFLEFELSLTALSELSQNPNSTAELPFPPNVSRISVIKNDYSETFCEKAVVAPFALEVITAHNTKQMLWRLIQDQQISLAEGSGLPIKIESANDLDLFAQHIIDTNKDELISTMLGYMSYKKHKFK